LRKKISVRPELGQFFSLKLLILILSKYIRIKRQRAELYIKIRRPASLKFFEDKWVVSARVSIVPSSPRLPVQNHFGFNTALAIWILAMYYDMAGNFEKFHRRLTSSLSILFFGTMCALSGVARSVHDAQNLSKLPSTWICNGRLFRWA